MDTRVADVTFEHLGVADDIAHVLVRRSRCLLHLRHALQDVLEVGLAWLAVGGIRQTVGDGLQECLCGVYGHLLHSGHILDGALCGHRAVGDDMCHILLTVFLCDP